MMRLKSLFRVCSPQLYVNINSLFIEASTDGHIARPFVLSEQSFLQDIETNAKVYKNKSTWLVNELTSFMQEFNFIDSSKL